MDRADREAAEALAGGDRMASGASCERPSRRQLPGQDLRARSCATCPHEAWQAHYAKVANPFLWFIQHQLYQLPYEPTIDEELIDAWQHGYRVVNEALARGRGSPQTRRYSGRSCCCRTTTCTSRRRPSAAQRPDSLLLHFNHIPWPAVDTWLVLPQGLRRAICEGLLANDIVGLQTDRYATQLPGSVDAFVRDARVDPAGRARPLARPDDLGARLPDLDRSRRAGAVRARRGGCQAAAR